MKPGLATCTPNDEAWQLYVVRTRLGTLYTGITKDVAKRLQEHESSRLGARYLRMKGPLTLVYHTLVGRKGTALRAEYRFKRLQKQQKEAIVRAQPTAPELLGLLHLS